jgi:hypothetical protein
MATESFSRSNRNRIPTESGAGILDLECRRFFFVMSKTICRTAEFLDPQICPAFG